MAIYQSLELIAVHIWHWWGKLVSDASFNGTLVVWAAFGLEPAEQRDCRFVIGKE